MFQADGDLAKAEEAFGLALELRPGHADALNNLGVVAEQLGHIEKAQKCYQAALQIHPDYIAAKNNLSALEQ